jgi:hypothetical protein
MTQEGKNVSSIVVFTKQFKALAGWRLALMNEGINTLFSTCHRLFPMAASPTCLEPPGLQRMKIAGRLLQIVHPTTMPFDANAQSSFYTLKVGPIAPHPRLGQPKAENAYRYSRPIRGASSPSMPRSAPHQQRDLFLRTCGHSPARMQLTTRNLARLRELYKNLAISQRELDQAASDQQTAKAICGRRCQQEARLPQPPS